MQYNNMLVSEEYYEESLMYVFLSTGHIDIKYKRALLFKLWNEMTKK
ncbi:hypothetical protein [Aliarcobacter butzleri]